MKCFPLSMLRRRRCFLLAVSVISFVNLIFMWRVSHLREDELKFSALRLTLTRKRRSLNHTPLTKPWIPTVAERVYHVLNLQTRISTVAPKRKEIEPTRLVTGPIHSTFGNLIANKDAQWPPTQKVSHVLT